MHKLSYNKPANDWNEALPLGNGKIGAMVYSGVFTDYIRLNEETIWSGAPDKYDCFHSAGGLKKIRTAVDKRDYAEAKNITEQTMHGLASQAYMSLGSIIIETRIDGKNKAYCDYGRELDLKTAVASSCFKVNGYNFFREYFVSAPDNVMAVRLESEIPVSYNITLSCELEHSTKAEDGCIAVQGRCPSEISMYKRVIKYDDNESVRFSMRLFAVSDGAVCSGGMIQINNSKNVTLYFTIATSFNGYDKMPVSQGKEYIKACKDRMEAAKSVSYEQLKNRHIKEYSEKYSRVSLNLRDDFQTELLFNYGRYLLISCSRPGTQAANLQGIWCCDAIAPWHSNYTLNINTEMNYWHSEVCRLGDCTEPLFSMLKDYSQRGNRFGYRGWSSWHNGDIWRFNCEATNDAVWGYWLMSGAWLCRHIWEHYLYTGDTEFLKEYFPVIKGAADFMCDWVIKDKDGIYTTCPSTSPENNFIFDETVVPVCSGTAMDIEILTDIMGFAEKAANILGKDGSEYAGIKEKLAPLKVGSDGRLLEWNEEFTENEPGHRHVSHLYGIYPSDVIIGDEKLKNAAEKSLLYRLENGGGHTGWSNAWIVCLFARLLHGDIAHKYIKNMLEKSIYPNYLDAHPPFQIDGNFGVCAGIAEMLIQSHEKYDGIRVVSLLPAAAGCWKKGEFKHFLVRGGSDISVSWGNGAAVKVVMGYEEKIIIRHAAGAVPEITGGSGNKASCRCFGEGMLLEGKRGSTFELKYRAERFQSRRAAEK